MKPPESKKVERPVTFINFLRKVQRSSTTLHFLASPAAQIQNFSLCYDTDFPKNTKFWVNFLFEKNFCGGLWFRGGAAGVLAMDLFSSTYFDENIIFVLSKDQSFRIRCTLMNPAQFLILVTHLIKGTFTVCLKKTHHFYFLKYLTNEKRYLPQIFTIL